MGKPEGSEKSGDNTGTGGSKETLKDTSVILPVLPAAEQLTDLSGSTAEDVTKKVDPKKVETVALDVANGNPAEAEKVIKLVDPALNAPGLPKGNAVYGYIAHELKKEMDKPDSEIKNSRFAQCAYVICNFIDKFFGFSMDADDYSSYVDAIYPEHSLTEDETAKTVEERKKERVVFYQKRGQLKDRLDKLNKELENKDHPLSKAQKDAKKEEILTIEERMKELNGKMTKLGIKLEDKEAKLDEELSAIIKKDKEKLSDEYIKKLKDLDNADAQISAAYVSGLLGYNVPSNDPEILYAKLLHTQYDVSGKADPDFGKRYKLFTQVTGVRDFSKLGNDKLLPPHTVVFFSVPVNGKGVLLCGIVGFDGKIRFHTKPGMHDTGLHEINDGVRDQKEEAMATSPDEGINLDDVYLSDFESALFGSKSFTFRGAFLPEEYLVKDKDEPAEPAEK